MTLSCHGQGVHGARSIALGLACIVSRCPRTVSPGVIAPSAIDDELARLDGALEAARTALRGVRAAIPANHPGKHRRVHRGPSPHDGGRGPGRCRARPDPPGTMQCRVGASAAPQCPGTGLRRHGGPLLAHPAPRRRSGSVPDPGPPGRRTQANWARGGGLDRVHRVCRRPRSGGRHPATPAGVAALVTQCGGPTGGAGGGANGPAR
jgi:hypothetical protein